MRKKAITLLLTALLVLTTVVTAWADGWVQVDEHWRYLKNGQYLTGMQGGIPGYGGTVLFDQEGNFLVTSDGDTQPPQNSMGNLTFLPENDGGFSTVVRGISSNLWMVLALVELGVIIVLMARRDRRPSGENHTPETPPEDTPKP